MGFLVRGSRLFWCRMLCRLYSLRGYMPGLIVYNRKECINELRTGNLKHVLPGERIANRLTTVIIRMEGGKLHLDTLNHRYMKRILLLLVAAAFAFAGCGPSIYKSTDFNSVATAHKTVAIIPANVMIQLRPNQMKNMTPEDLQKNQEATGYALQDKLYGWFLRRSNDYKYTVNFQDISRTNALLKEANISYKDLQTKSKDELAKLLGVDAIISTSVRTDKPMNEGVAAAIGVVFGVWGQTNTAYTTINIHEGKKGDLMWKYDYQAGGSVGSSPENLINGLMRNASKKFPYNARG